MFQTEYIPHPWPTTLCSLNTLRPRQNGRHFPDDIFQCIFLNENVWISISISLKVVPVGPINNIPALIQIMAWRRPGDKPLSEPMMFKLPTHICVTRPQWVKCITVLKCLTTCGLVTSYCVFVCIGSGNLAWSNAALSPTKQTGTISVEFGYFLSR